MNNSNALLDRANKFLNHHTFEIEDIFGVVGASLNVKVKLLKFEKYISMGEPKTYIEYDLFILKSENDSLNTVINSLFNSRTKEIVLDTSNTFFYFSLEIKIHFLLENLLKYMGLDFPVICKKIKKLD